MSSSPKFLATLKKRNFARAFCRLGNAVEAAKESGWRSKNMSVVASQMMADPFVREEITRINTRIDQELADSLMARQQYLTEVFFGRERDAVSVEGVDVSVPVKMADRLRAGRNLSDIRGEIRPPALIEAPGLTVNIMRLAEDTNVIDHDESATNRG